MSSMTVNINFVRFDDHEGTYVCKEVMVDADDPNIMHFDWTVSREVTEASGKLTVIVCLKKDNAGGLTSQVWHSQRCETFSVLPGLLCDSVTIPSDPEYNGVQVDYNQNDKLAADYIKNRPFYKIDQTYTFTEDDNYKTPVCNVNMGPEDDPVMVGLYKISDDTIPIKQINDTTASLRTCVEIDGEFQYMYNIPWWLDKGTGDKYPGDPNDTYLTVYPYDIDGQTPDDMDDAICAAFDLGIMVYKEFNTQGLLDIDIILAPGIYALMLRDPDSGFYFIFDEIITADIKRMDSSYLPTDEIVDLISHRGYQDEYQVRELISQNSISESRVNAIVNNVISKSVTSVLGGSS